MCLQDAGWRFGPWLQREPGAYAPSEYVTWRHYFARVATTSAAPAWRLSQEDIQVSLVWGAQVLQRIAQQMRGADNQIVMAEKLATLAGVYQRTPWPAAALEEAWRTLLLAQHHDCWIVPCNGRRNDTWADKVRRWTEATGQASEQSRRQSAAAFRPRASSSARWAVRVLNTLAGERTNLVRVQLPANWSGASANVRNQSGHELVAQVVGADSVREVLFAAPVPSLGYTTFWLEPAAASPVKGASVVQQPDGTIRMETDYYRGWEVPTMRLSDGKVLIRLFNASPDNHPRTIRYAGPASKIELVHLNGRVIKDLPLRREATGSAVFDLALPSMGIGTLQVTP